MSSRPSFQFYPGDWLHDAALRVVSVGARGLWIEMICLMHQGSDYGHLKVNSKAITDIQLSRMVGEPIGEVQAMLAELENAGVFSRADDGSIISRRMIRDEEMRSIRASGGKLGGSPKLGADYNKPGYIYAMLRSSDGAVKIGISQDPSKRLYKIKAQYPGDDISVIGKLHVDNMGLVEASLHAEFAHCKSGEWFSLTQGEKQILLDVHLKANQTPSSSSSSSSSSSEDITVTNVTVVAKPSLPTIANVPREKILESYHELLPTCPPVRTWNKTRGGYLAARWKEDPKRQSVEWWRGFFQYVGQSQFLTGRGTGRDGSPPFVADLEWIIRPTNFAKIIEGKYHRAAA